VFKPCCDGDQSHALLGTQRLLGCGSCGGGGDDSDDTDGDDSTSW